MAASDTTSGLCFGGRAGLAPVTAGRFFEAAAKTAAAGLVAGG
jgi:hypothetical protein